MKVIAEAGPCLVDTRLVAHPRKEPVAALSVIKVVEEERDTVLSDCFISFPGRRVQPCRKQGDDIYSWSVSCMHDTSCWEFMMRYIYIYICDEFGAVPGIT